MADAESSKTLLLEINGFLVFGNLFGKNSCKLMKLLFLHREPTR